MPLKITPRISYAGASLSLDVFNEEVGKNGFRAKVSWFLLLGDILNKRRFFMSISLCLIALCLGYLVFYQGSQAKEGLKLLGQTIGVIVMVISLLSSMCCLAQASGAKWSGLPMITGCPLTGGMPK